MMATVDAVTGKVYEPPLSRNGWLNVPLDHLGDMEIDFRPDSSLLVLRNGLPGFCEEEFLRRLLFQLEGQSIHAP